MYANRIRQIAELVRAFPRNAEYTAAELEAVADQVEELENSIVPAHLRQPAASKTHPLRLVKDDAPLNSDEGEE